MAGYMMDKIVRGRDSGALPSAEKSVRWWWIKDSFAHTNHHLHLYQAINEWNRMQGAKP
jgi:hypothetical protein